MKLVEILARELKEWPNGANSAVQSRGGKTVFFYFDDDYADRYDFLAKERAEDNIFSRVNRSQWEAERARIASQSVSMSDEDVAFVKSDFYREMVDRKIEQDLAAIACGKRSKEDQELWDKVAREYFIDFVQGERQGAFGKTIVECMELAGIAADAFMAERAKRMKG